MLPTYQLELLDLHDYTILTVYKCIIINSSSRKSNCIFAKVRMEMP